MFDRPPDGFFVRDLIVFNHLRRGGFVAKGFVLQAPDLTNSPIADLNDFQDQICLLLASLQENQRLQIQYFCDSDYQEELLRYQRETEKMTNLWTKRSRNERFTRYWDAMFKRELRRQRAVVYIARPLENIPRLVQTGRGRREYYLALLEQLQTEYEHTHRLLLEIFANTGTRIVPMTDLDHFRHYLRFLNPSLDDRFDYDFAAGFAPELSIQENCWHSEGNGQSDFGFFMDGHYHSIIVLTRWPRTTYPGIIQRLTNLRLLDYTITVNIDPLPVTREISKEEKAHDRVAGDYASEKKISLLTVMEKKQWKIAALMQGQTIPVVPIMQNTYYPPNQPRPRRSYEFGSALRNAIETWKSHARVAVLASGGFSHFVLDEELDHKALQALQDKDIDAIASLPLERLQSGTSEIRNWITTAGAVQHLDMEVFDYVPCYRSLAGTGCAMAFAQWA